MAEFRQRLLEETLESMGRHRRARRRRHITTLTTLAVCGVLGGSLFKSEREQGRAVISQTTARPVEMTPAPPESGAPLIKRLTGGEPPRHVIRLRSRPDVSSIHRVRVSSRTPTIRRLSDQDLLESLPPDHPAALI